MDDDNHAMKYLYSLFVALVVVGACGGHVSAIGTDTVEGKIGLQLAPLEYRTSLAPGQSKKGFVIVSNPTNRRLLLKTSVTRFQQVDSSGALKFLKDEQISAGVQPDLKEFELQPLQSVQMYFQVDGTKLPQGDVYAALFFTAEPFFNRGGTISASAARVGTLLSITNGTPTGRSARITDLYQPRFQVGDSIQGKYTVRNTGDPKTTTGFYPEVVVQTNPFPIQKTVVSSLVFPGISRSNQYRIDVKWPGVYKVRVGYADSFREQWVVVAQWWHLVVMGLLLAGSTALIVRSLAARRRPKKRSRITSRRSRR